MISKAVVLAAVAAMLVGCGGTGPVDDPGALPDDPASAIPDGPDGTEGGFGTPTLAVSEFDRGPGRPVTGTLLLEDDGCWYVEFFDATALAIFPEGFEIPFDDDPSVLLGPDGQQYASGTAIDGRVNQVWPEELPGGADGRWGNYVAFCDPAEPSVAVFTELAPEQDVLALTDGEVAALVADATFTVDWACGRGWAASTEDEAVGLFVYQQSTERLEAGATVQLPDDGWSAQLVVGKYLFLNHCDDVFEQWEPDQVRAAEWPVAGTLEVADTFPDGEEPAEVGALLTGAQVTLDDGTTIELGDVALFNRSFNAFAG